MMRREIGRREFAKTLAVGLGVLSTSPLHAFTRRNLKVGHTGITWGFSPADAMVAIRDVGVLGYEGFESFGNVLESWEERGGIGNLLNAVNLPLRGAYCPINLTVPARRAEEVAKVVRWGRLIHKYGGDGSIAVLGPNNVQRASFNIAEHRDNIVAALNDVSMALMDIGIIGAVHPHTGTCIETGEETYAVMQAVDSRYVKFCPDVGQLLKAGADPVRIVRDFLSITHHIHMKDYDGGPEFLGYAPLGMGNLETEALADLCEASGNDIMIMVELDPNNGPRPMPMTAHETARISKGYLQSIGYTFDT
jgi:inosose dehydratase